MDLSLWVAFSTMFATALAIPGPNVAFAVAQSLQHGVARALAAAVGFALGTGFHAAMILSGVGFLVRHDGHVFAVLKWAGVSYLLYYAVKSWVATGGDFELLDTETTSSRRLVLGAFAVSCTNPKGWLASLMIYPAFISARLPYAPQAIGLGLTAMAISLLVYGSYVVVASQVRRHMTNRVMLNRIVSVVYLLVAAAIAFSV